MEWTRLQGIHPQQDSFCAPWDIHWLVQAKHWAHFPGHHLPGRTKRQIPQLSSLLFSLLFQSRLIYRSLGVASGEGNGNPLQCSCLENPRDGGAWWAAVYGVAQSWTWLKRLSSSSSRRCCLWTIPRVPSMFQEIASWRLIRWSWESLSFLSLPSWVTWLVP